MNIFVAIIVTLFSSSVMAKDSPARLVSKNNNIFEKYIGCYSTIKFNGNPIEEGSIGESKFYNRNNSPFLDPETVEELPSIGMILYRGQDSTDNSDSYEFQYILANRGSVFTDNTGDHFVFDGKLFDIGASEINTFHIKYDILPLGNSQYQVNLYMRIDDYDWESESSYILEQRPCSPQPLKINSSTKCRAGSKNSGHF